jgi:hypothetical protein
LTGGLGERAARLRRSLGRVTPPGAERLGRELDELRLAAGRIESRLIADLTPGNLREAEFRIFSQFGEDGIIQHLTDHVRIENEVFVEFGVEDYSESNTRFLVAKDNWRGLIIDGGTSHIEFLRSSGLGWRHELDAVSAFIDRDNINDLITGAGISGDIGVLSIDIDGNDYWVLERITSVAPRILVVEYNSIFGSEHAVTIPYDPHFARSEAHSSNLYWGASLAALTRVANAKGLALVGGNSAGNNAFYVRRDLLGALPEASVAAAWAPSRFRESRNASGELTYVSGHADRLALIRSLPLVDLVSSQERTVADLFSV